MFVSVLIVCFPWREVLRCWFVKINLNQFLGRQFDNPTYLKDFQLLGYHYHCLFNFLFPFSWCKVITLKRVVRWTVLDGADSHANSPRDWSSEKMRRSEFFFSRNMYNNFAVHFAVAVHHFTTENAYHASYWDWILRLAFSKHRAK